MIYTYLPFMILLADLWLLSGVVYVLLKTCGDE